ncbi:hypothetical protein QBC39DRAFT_344793 [Podospora conica]|nr:hypothetical protein QBC39DRAFT_344793 [Schizothecium conicum]
MLTIDSFLSSSFLNQLRAVIQMSPPQSQPGVQDAGIPALAPKEVATRRVRRPKITQPQVGSLYDIMHDNAGTSLYNYPICWTDLHAQLLGAHFQELPAIVKPVPSNVPGRCLEPSSMGRAITADLHLLVKKTIPQPAWMPTKLKAIRMVLAKLFPETLSRAQTSVELDVYFGTRRVKGAVRLPCVWRTPYGPVFSSFDSLPTIPAGSFDGPPAGARDTITDYAPNQPILAYVNRTQLTSIRAGCCRVHLGPNGSPNKPVAGLQRLRYKNMLPANPEHDAYIAGIMLAMAQSHFYHISTSRPSSRRSSSPRGSNGSGTRPMVIVDDFHDIEVRVITHDEGDDANPNFMIYSAVVTATFLERFRHPERAPALQEGEETNGIQITHTTVPFWPILGLKERLAQALGSQIGGQAASDDPNHIGLWDQLIEKPNYPDLMASIGIPPATPKRKSNKRSRAEAASISLLLDASFEEEPASSPEDQPVLSPSAKRRRTAQTANTLRVF